MHWVAEWIVRRTVALGLVLVNPTRSVHTATSVLAELSALADAGLMWIALAAGVASALESVQSLPALGVHSARSSQALVSS